MTQAGISDSPRPGEPGRFVFCIDVKAGFTPDGQDRYGVSCWRDGCWRGMVVADTLDEAAAAAVRWHVTGELQ